MRKVVMVIALIMLALITACGDKEASDKGPSHIPVKWANAMIQRDDRARLEMLEKPTKALDSGKGPENKKKVTNYELSEWKSSSKKYFYEIKFIDPISDKGRTEQMEVVKTDKGWKRTQFSNLKDFSEVTKNLDRSTLKEMNES